MGIAATTIGLFIKEIDETPSDDTSQPAVVKQLEQSASQKDNESAKKTVKAKYPHHVWHIDLTTVPIAGGFWTYWSPIHSHQRYQSHASFRTSYA